MATDINKSAFGLAVYSQWLNDIFIAWITWEVWDQERLGIVQDVRMWLMEPHAMWSTHREVACPMEDEPWDPKLSGSVGCPGEEQVGNHAVRPVLFNQLLKLLIEHPYGHEELVPHVLWSDRVAILAVVRQSNLARSDVKSFRWTRTELTLIYENSPINSCTSCSGKFKVRMLISKPSSWVLLMDLRNNCSL